MGEFLVKGTFQLDLASKQELIRGIRTDGLRINYQSIVESERQIIWRFMIFLMLLKTDGFKFQMR